MSRHPEDVKHHTDEAEFEYYESIHDMNKFIEWYKENISFCSQEGKELGAKVISQLKVGNNKYTVLRTYKK